MEQKPQKPNKRTHAVKRTELSAELRSIIEGSRCRREIILDYLGEGSVRQAADPCYEMCHPNILPPFGKRQHPFERGIPVPKTLTIHAPLQQHLEEWRYRACKKLFTGSRCGGMSAAEFLSDPLLLDIVKVSKQESTPDK